MRVQTVKDTVATQKEGKPNLNPIAQAPWREGLAHEASAALALPSLRTLPAETVDVAVIGGGGAGMSAVWSAADAGARVLLLEAGGALGEGATGRNAGILSAGINMGLADLPPDGPDAAMWPATTKVLLSLACEAQEPE